MIPASHPCFGAEAHTTMIEIQETDELKHEEEASCGVCLAGHACLRQLISVLWLVTVPFKFIETAAMTVPIWYLSFMAHLDATLLLSSFAFGFLVSKTFSVISFMSFHTSCTLYLSTLAWLLGQVFISHLAMQRCVPLIRLTRSCGQDTKECRWLYTLGPTGYFGLTAGMLAYFFDVTLQRDSWCRASEAWPAETVYIPVFFAACLSAVVYLPKLEYPYAQNRVWH